MQKGILQPLPNLNPPNPNTLDYNSNKHCKFHQNLNHSTDNCIRLKHEIQNLIDSGKIIDPETWVLEIIHSQTTEMYHPQQLWQSIQELVRKKC